MYNPLVYNLFYNFVTHSFYNFCRVDSETAYRSYRYFCDNMARKSKILLKIITKCLSLGYGWSWESRLKKSS